MKKAITLLVAILFITSCLQKAINPSKGAKHSKKPYKEYTVKEGYDIVPQTILSSIFLSDCVLKVSDDGYMITKLGWLAPTQLWDLKEGNIILNYRRCINCNYDYDPFNTDSDWKTVACVSDDKHIDFFGLKTGRFKKSIKVKNYYESIKINSKKNLIYGKIVSTINIIDANSGKVLHKFEGEKVLDVDDEWYSINAYDVKGDYVIARYENGNVFVWNGKNGKLIKKFKEGNDAINAILIDRNLKYFFTACSSRVKVWSLKDFKVVKTLKSKKGFRGFLKQSDKQHCLILVDNSGYALLWNYEKDKILKKVKIEKYNPDSSIDISKNFKYIVMFTPEHNFKVVNTVSGEQKTIMKEKEAYIYFIHPLKNGRDIPIVLKDSILMFNFRKRKMRVINLSKNKEFEKKDNPVAISPDGKYLLTEGKTLKIWNIYNGKLYKNLKINLIPSCYGFSYDNKKLLMGALLSTLVVYDINKEKIEYETGIPGLSATGVFMTPDNKYILAGTMTNRLVILDVVHKKELTNFRLSQQWQEIAVGDFCLSPDGRYLSFTSGDRAGILDLNSLKLINDIAFSLDMAPPENLFASPSYVAFTHDGKGIVCEFNRYLYFIDLNFGGDARKFPANTGVSFIATIPKTNLFAGISDDNGKIFFWDYHRNIGKLIITESKEWIYITPDGHFTPSKNAMRFIRFTKNGKSYPAEKFY